MKEVLQKEEYRVDKKTKFKNLEFSEEILQKEEDRVDKNTKFKNLEFSEEVFKKHYWHRDRQLDDFFRQNPREKENMEEWWKSLSLEDLKRILNNERKLGRFKP